MRKVKGWAIFTTVLLTLLVAALVVDLIIPDKVQALVLSLYNEITSEGTNSFDVVYRLCKLIVVSAFAILFVVNQILLFYYGSLASKSTADAIVDAVKTQVTTQKVQEELKTVSTKARTKNARKASRKVESTPVTVVVQQAPAAQTQNVDSVESFLSQFGK